MKYLILLLIIFILSCQKEDKCEFDKLTGDQTQFIGLWQWEYSLMYHYNNSTGQLMYIDTMTPQIFGRNFSIEFDSESYLILKTNSSYFDEGFFKIKNWSLDNLNSTGYGFKELYINMNPCFNSQHEYKFYIKGDTLNSTLFPYPDAVFYTNPTTIYSYSAVFIRR